jgi:hypothetical protein
MSIEDQHSEVYTHYESIRHKFPNADYHEIDGLFFKFKELYEWSEEHEESLVNEMTTEVDDNLHEILEDLMEELNDIEMSS